MGRCGYILERKKLNELLKVLAIKSDDERIITKITCHSKDVIKDSIFVAIDGKKESGLNFVEEALDKGAIVVSESEDLRTYKVDNSKEAYALLLHCFYGQPTNHLKCIGITGTNGKSSTAFLICEMFESLGHSCCFIGTHGATINHRHINTLNTTPHSEVLVHIFNQCIKENVEIVVMEVSSMALKMERLYGCLFDVIIYTNIKKDHIEEHGSYEDYVYSKKLALNYLKKNSVVIYNSDDATCSSLMSKQKRAYSFGKKSNYFKISSIIESKNSTSFYLNETLINTPLKSSANVYNLVASLVCGYFFDLNWEDCIQWASNCKMLSGRFELVARSPDIYVDYAHTASAFETLCSYFKKLWNHQLIVVFGCGGDRDRSKRRVMGELACRYCDEVILTNDNPRTEDPCQIINDIVEGCNKDVHIEYIRSKAIKKAFKLAGKNDIILVVGKGDEKFQLNELGKVEMNDKELILSILREEI